MKKKNVNLPVIAVAVVAVCLVAIAGVLVMKASNSGPAVSPDSVSDSVGGNSNYYVYEEETTESTLQSIWDITTQAVEETYEAATQATTKKPTTTKKTTTTTKATESTTVKEEPEVLQSSGASAPSASSSGSLPSDMTFAGLYRAGYDIIGLKPYIYNNDKEDCFQAEWGYNPLYDAGANLIDFDIETTKLDFNYDGKKYRIQLWKGQYISGDIGTVGGEIGVYTRNPDKAYLMREHYDCAAEDDWVKMEMTVLWDENGDGNYLPQFTRNYDTFWWATGFVDGQLADRNDSNSLRLLGRITFESEEQAQAFASAMSGNGFTEVSTFNPTVIDTFKIYGKDVIFLWQNIR